MPNAEFLESYPLYRKFKVDIPITLDDMPKPRINMECAVCNETRSFAMTNEYWHGKPYSNFPSDGQSVVASFQCLFCQVFDRHFFLIISEDLDTIWKAGQFPPWSVKPNSDISKMLGSHKDYLAKGLVCESQSYGIAAFSYYRRITEEIIDAMLDEIADLISEDERVAYNAALEDVKRTRVTAEKIDLVKDMLPSILRPEGMNPLALLHGILSEGLHGKSEEECLELAVEVREILTFLASQVAVAKAASRSFTDRMRTLLDKRLKPAA